MIIDGSHDHYSLLRNILYTLRPRIRTKHVQLRTRLLNDSRELSSWGYVGNDERCSRRNIMPAKTSRNHTTAREFWTKYKIFTKLIWSKTKTSRVKYQTASRDLFSRDDIDYPSLCLFDFYSNYWDLESWSCPCLGNSNCCSVASAVVVAVVVAAAAAALSSQ